MRVSHLGHLGSGVGLAEALGSDGFRVKRQWGQYGLLGTMSRGAGFVSEAQISRASHSCASCTQCHQQAQGMRSEVSVWSSGSRGGEGVSRHGRGHLAGEAPGGRSEWAAGTMMSDPRSRPCSLCPQVSFTLSVCCRQNCYPPTPVAPVPPAGIPGLLCLYSSHSLFSNCTVKTLCKRTWGPCEGKVSLALTWNSSHPAMGSAPAAGTTEHHGPC